MNYDPNNFSGFDLEKLAPAPTILLWEHSAPINPAGMALFHQGHFDVERVSTLDQLLDSALRSSHPLTGENKFEMIMLAEELLEVEGVQLLMLLKSMPETRNVPILVVGSTPASSNFDLWMQAGAHGFMTR
jgi:DNA-binding response OmpR family regulator